jgi:trans-aconitate 2-methyltransferase
MCASRDSGGTVTDQWISEAYLRIPTLRTQAVLDLLARVQHPGPRLVVDLGCGPGNATELIAEHWPRARVIGVDNSPNMIAAANGREQPGQLEFRLGDLATWQADEPVDVMLFNAVLQWIPGHAGLMPRFAAMLAPGGVLGFQMPGRWPGPGGNDVLMEIILDLTREPRWRDKLGNAYGDDTFLLDPVGYITALTGGRSLGDPVHLPAGGNRPPGGVRVRLDTAPHVRLPYPARGREVPRRARPAPQPGPAAARHRR